MLAKLTNRLKKQDNVHLLARLYIYILKIDGRLRICYYNLLKSLLLEEFIESSASRLDAGSRKRSSMAIDEYKQRDLHQLLEGHKRIRARYSARGGLEMGASEAPTSNHMSGTLANIALVNANQCRLRRHQQPTRDVVKRTRSPSWNTGAGRARLRLDDDDDDDDHDEKRWNWLDFPELLPGTSAYTKCSTCWMVYAVLRSMLQESLAQFVGKLSWPALGVRGGCLLLGRLVTHTAIGMRSSVLFAGFHLIWRSTMWLAHRKLRLTMVHFLLHTDADIEHFYQIIKRDQELAQASPLLMASSLPSSLVLRQRRHMAAAEQQLLVVEEAPTPPPISLNERLLRHTMCYSVYYGNRIFFKLRPNRTPEARLRLYDQTAKSFVFATGLLLVLASVFIPYGVLHIISDRRYLANYPGCLPSLEESQARGQLALFSVTPKGHRLVAAFGDTLENMFVWIDGALALTHGTTFCYLLNYDIMLYWSSLQAKLELLLRRVRHRSPFYMWPGAGLEFGNSKFAAKVATTTERCPNDWQLDAWQLENEIHELQFEVMDFFHEIRRVDLLISDLLTLTIIIWLSGCAMLFYNFLTERKTIPLIIEVMMVIGFAVFTVVTHYLLLLRRCCLRSYQTICSLMAHDVGEKMGLMKLMDYFIEMNGITYTLAQSYPYKPTTFLAILGYTVSCVLMVMTLFSHEDDNDNLHAPVAAKPDGSSSHINNRQIEPSNSFERLLRELAIS